MSHSSSTPHKTLCSLMVYFSFYLALFYVAVQWTEPSVQCEAFKRTIIAILRNIWLVVFMLFNWYTVYIFIHMYILIIIYMPHKFTHRTKRKGERRHLKIDNIETLTSANAHRAFFLAYEIFSGLLWFSSSGREIWFCQFKAELTHCLWDWGSEVRTQSCRTAGWLATSALEISDTQPAWQGRIADVWPLLRGYSVVSLRPEDSVGRNELAPRSVRKWSCTLAMFILCQNFPSGTEPGGTKLL